MHLCLTVECIASSLHFLQHRLSVLQSISFNLIRPKGGNPHFVTVNPSPRGHGTCHRQGT